MTASRAVLAGSALPLVVLLAIAGVPAVRVAAGLPGPTSAPRAGVGGESAALRSPEPPSAAAAAQERAGLERLRRSITAGRTLSFRGTQIVTVWHAGGSTTRLLAVQQRPGQPRLVTARDTIDRASADGVLVTDGLTGLSERALRALAAEYQVTSAGTDQVAGRTADVVVASRGNREMARFWVDRRDGVLLRQELFDDAGRLHRMAAYVDLRVESADSLTAEPVAGDRPDPSAGSTIAPAELASLRASGWPCPAALPRGFALLDARRGSTPAEHSVVHLTYGDGLSAISVFIQPGRLDDDRLSGMSRRRWDGGDVHFREGWPTVLVWQGGPNVITAIGDAPPDEFEVVLGGLPRSSGGSRSFLPRSVGSAMAWLRG